MMPNNAYSHREAQDDVLHMTISEIEIGDMASEHFWPVTLHTSRGDVEYRYYHSLGFHGFGDSPSEQAQPQAKAQAAIFVGSVEGGWDTPGEDDLYPNICQALNKQGISSLWVQYRKSTSLIESILDVLAGIFFLRSQQFTSIALIGHSFGGAVTLQAAAASDMVKAAVVISTQLYGIDAASRLRKDTSTLFIHGLDDNLLSPLCSIQAFNRVQGSKELILLNKVQHDLTAVSHDIEKKITTWLVEKLT